VAGRRFADGTFPIFRRAHPAVHVTHAHANLDVSEQISHVEHAP
jgi:hypothetical protein